MSNTSRGRDRSTTRHVRRTLAGLIAALPLLAVAACRDLTSLQQSNPGTLSAASTYVPANAQLLVNGAIGDFECAFSRYVAGSGLFTDELSDAISNTDNFDYDRRTIRSSAAYGTATCGNNQQPPIYTTLSTARGSNDTVAAKLRGWTDAEMAPGVNRTKLIGQASAYAGYSLVLLGEGMCSAAINAGPELTPAQVFAEAKSRFDSAIVAATAASDATTLNLATLGRARTLLDLGQPAAAATDAAKIPAGFIVNMSTDAINLRRENWVYASINIGPPWSTVEPISRGLTVNGAPDPRVAVTNTGKAGTTSGTQVWTVDKYPALNTPIPVARWAEAQFIIADAKLAANDIPGAVAAINAVRSTRPGLPPYDATGQTLAQVQTQLVEERRRELFLEGHRLGDLRRYNLPFAPLAGTPYPGGGGVYGTQTCFPLPDVERINNPNIAKP